MLAQQTRSTTSAPRLIVLWALAPTTAIAVFAMPLLFPPAHPALSPSYTAGFNNRLSVLAAGSISVGVLWLLWRYRVTFVRDKYRSEPIPLRWLAAIAIACTIFTFVFGVLLYETRTAYNDIRYFLEPMDLVETWHERIYKDFAFMYGPLLLYLPVAVHALLRPLHFPIAAAYYVALAVGQSIGLLILFYVVNALPARRGLKIAFYIFYGVQTLKPLMGLNYSFIRGGLPFAALIVLARIANPWQAAIVACAAEMLTLGVSPEVGVAFGAGAVCYGALKGYQSGRVWLPTAVSAPFGAAFFAIWVGRGYFDSLSSFSRGNWAFIVEPVPHILVYLFALVWLAPLAVATRLRDHSPDAPMLLAIYAASLGLLPPAFGRSDPLHVMFNGLGVYLLSLVAVSDFGRRQRIVWAACAGAVLLWAQVVDFHVYRFQYRPALRWAFSHMPRGAVYDAVVKLEGHAPGSDPSYYDTPTVDISILEMYVGHDPVATPVFIPLGLEDDLKRTGHYVPDYDTFLIGVGDAETEMRKVERLNRSKWAMIPRSAIPYAETPETQMIPGMGFRYPHRRKPFECGLLILQDFESNWALVAHLGAFDLYSRKPA